MWENQSPGHWCTCCQIFLCYSMLPPLGKPGHCTVTVASAEPVMTKNVVITDGRSLSVLGREVTELSINTSPTKTNVFITSRVLSDTLKYSNSEKQQQQQKNSGRASNNVNDQSARFSGNYPVSSSKETMTPYLFHLLSDRPSVTSVSIYGKPIRHCLGVILLKEYIIILIYYYSYDDL